MKLLLYSIAFFCTGLSCAFAQVQVTFYPTYGYQENEDWVIPIMAWVHKPHTKTEAALKIIARAKWGDRPQELDNFMARAHDFIADDQEDVPVKLVFEGDKKEYEIKNEEGVPQVTNHDGYVTGRIRIPLAEATPLLKGETEGWLTFHAAAGNDSEPGRVRLIGPTGVSVISDIDDTIKVSEIPAGAEVVAKNTMLRPYLAADGMKERYQEWEKKDRAVFHYVSAGPWQLYRPLGLFRQENQFPEGSFNMRVINLGFSHLKELVSMMELMMDKEATFNHKVARITELMGRFPERKFILVGDSGEKDPEVYAAIRNTKLGERKLGERVIDVFIRDVVRPMGDMKIIQGGICRPGISQFDGANRSP